MNKRLFHMIGLAISLALPLTSPAQTYPDKPVRMIVPFPAGTATDVGARMLSQKLQEALGQPFVVENKPGAAGTIGAMEVVRAKPDGYTLLFSSNSAAASNVALVKSMPYNPATDLSPIAGIGEGVLVLMVRAEHPAKNVQELVAYLAQRQGKSTAGYGSASTQISIAVLNKRANLDVLAVPYKGIPMAANDTIGGMVDFTFVDMGNALSLANGGRLRALGVTSEKRSPLAPTWPALGETISGFDVNAWLAVFGPPSMSPEVVGKLNASIAEIVNAPEMREKLASTGMQPMVMTAEQLKRFVPVEIEKWKRLAKDANIAPQ
jgi:tripartite-type tricarboxylate transporter receptor subunit TctC